MAAVSVYGVENTNAFQSSPVENVNAAKAGGRVRAIVDSYTANAVEAASTIDLGGIKIPSGAEIVGWTVDHEAMGASVTMQLQAVGATTVNLSAALNVAAAGTKIEDNAQGYVPKSITSDSVFRILTAGATTTASDLDVQVVLYYTID